MPIDSEQNWSQVFQGNYQTAQFGSSKGRIEPITIPFLIQHTVRIYTTSLNAELHWWLAGRLTQVLGSVEQEMEATRWEIPLNRLLFIQVPQLTSTYKLKFEAVRWLKYLEIVIDEEQGEIFSTNGDT